MGGNFGAGAGCAGCGETLVTLVYPSAPHDTLNLQIITWTTSSDMNEKSKWIGDYWIGLKKAANGGWKWDYNSGKFLRENSDLGWWRSEHPHNDHGCAAVGWGGTEVMSAHCNNKKPVLCVKRKFFICFKVFVCFAKQQPVKAQQNFLEKLCTLRIKDTLTERLRKSTYMFSLTLRSDGQVLSREQ